MFITDSEEDIIVSFDEDAQDDDISKDCSVNSNSFSIDKKSICQLRGDSVSDRHAFFMIKIKNASEESSCLIGQMVVKAAYRWCDGEVEPVLKNLLDCVTVND